MDHGSTTNNKIGGSQRCLEFLVRCSLHPLNHNATKATHDADNECSRRVTGNKLNRGTEQGQL